MLAVNKSAGIALEVNLRNSLHVAEEAHTQEIQPGFETLGRHHQKSKREISTAPQKGLISLIIFLPRKRRINSYAIFSVSIFYL